jgi:hypothetical protein
MEVREQDEVERRQVRKLHGWIGEPRGVHAGTKPGLLMLVDEGRIGQDRDTGNFEQHGCVPDERQGS